MKNVSKNKFLTCFRPVVDIDTNTIAMHDDTKSMFSDPKSTQNRVVHQPSKRAFAKVIKAVVFETILSTRARNKKLYSQNCFGSKRQKDSSSTTSEASLDSNVKEMKALELFSSSSSTPSSSRVSESKSISKYKPSEDQLEKQKKCQFVGICMVLISLAVTVLCGKVHVIILTSVLFCFSSVWNRRKEVAKLFKVDSKASKNRENNGRLVEKKVF